MLTTYCKKRKLKELSKDKKKIKKQKWHCLVGSKRN